MQIEEKQIVINGQNITLRSPGKQDAETFSEVRDITYRETYFLARYPEETDFTADAAEAMVKKKSMENCKECFVLADESKFNQISSVTFAPFEGATVITTGLSLPAYKKCNNVIDVKQ